MNAGTVTWLDIAFLWIIMEFQRTHQDVPNTYDLLSLEGNGEDGLLYKFIHDNQIPRLFTGKISFKNRRILGDSITSLRNASLLRCEGHYVPTPKGIQLFEYIGTDWRNWPQCLDISAGLPVLDTATPFPTHFN